MPVLPDLDAATVASLAAGLAAGQFTAVELTEAYLARIAELNPTLNAVIAVHPDAGHDAAASDARRAAGAALGALDGIPVLVKDNVAVAGLPTTAGSRALADSTPPDAPLVSRLRGAGAVILGKANLSEWANFRSTRSSSGWSATGGQTRNPHALDRNTSGSSSGSGAAVAASLTQLAIGTETDGSITSPAGVCGIVGLKPTVGSVPGAGIVPISSAQDTAGPMTRTVADAAILQAVLADGPAIPLDAEALAGAAIGVWRPAGAPAETLAVLDAAADTLRAAGARVLDVELDPKPIIEPELAALYVEFRQELDAYLAAAPGSGPRSLSELVEFNRADPTELSVFGQEHLERALLSPGPDDEKYQAQRAEARRLAQDLIDEPLRTHQLDAIMTLTNSPAWLTDHTNGDRFGLHTATPAAVAGYPALSVPAGSVGPLPVGITLIGTAGTDARLLSLGYAFEQRTLARLRPGYLAGVD